MVVAQDQSSERSPQPWGTYAPNGLSRVVLALSRHTLLGRGFARKRMFSAFEALHGSPVDVILWQTPVRLHPSNNVSERKALMRPDRVDAAEHAVLQWAMARPGAVFVDIGGNAGIYSLSAALHAGEAARILMIEPDPSLIARFAFNLAAAQERGLVKPTVRVETFALAISDGAGTGVLSSDSEEGSRSLMSTRVDPGSSGLSSDRSGRGGTGSDPGVSVALVTLDQLTKGTGLDRIDVMKIDVEGHEDRVLPPFFDTAPSRLWPGLIIIEHLQRSSWKRDCIAMALEQGYRVTLTTRNNTVLQCGERIDETTV